MMRGVDFRRRTCQTNGVLHVLLLEVSNSSYEQVVSLGSSLSFASSQSHPHYRRESDRV